MGLSVLVAAGCRRPVPEAAGAQQSPQATLAGSVRSPAGAAAVQGRTVEAINVQTGERRAVVTGSGGSFTFDLPAGRYRLEPALRPGESVIRQPGIIDVARGDVDGPIDIVLAEVRITHPHGPAYRIDNALGAPIA